MIFDYGGVLCFHPSDSKIDALAELCGLERERFLELYWRHRVGYDRGDFEPAGYWARLATDAGRSYTAAQVEEFRRRDVDFWVDTDRVMLGWIDALRNAGLRIGLISNLPRDLGEHLRAAGFFHRFDHVTLSYEQRTVKPDAAIYLECCAGLGVDPPNAMFLDDREHNVAGGCAAGLLAVRFENPARLAAELESSHPSIGSMLSKVLENGR